MEGGHAAQVRTDDDARLSGSIQVPGILLGLGLGGFVDGIVLHQILQWHHMLSGTEAYPPTTLGNMRVNMSADGLLHAAAWIFVAAGLAALWRAVRSGRTGTWRSMVGWMMVGWGAFNLVEGVVDHHILEIHRVRPGASNPLVWDIGFLSLGVLLILAGWVLQRSDVASRREIPG